MVVGTRSCHHLNLPVPPPSYETWDHQAPSRCGDDASDAALVGPESRRGLPGSRPGVEAGDLFLPLCHEVALLADTLLGKPDVVGVLGGMAMDGGDKSIGGGSDGGIKVLVASQEVLRLFGG